MRKEGARWAWGGVAASLLALALDAWVWFAPFSHGDEPRLAAVLLVASNAVVAALVCAELVRRRRGMSAPLYWAVVLFAVSAAVVTWKSWHLIV